MTEMTSSSAMMLLPEVEGLQEKIDCVKALIVEFKEKIELWQTEWPDIPMLFNEELLSLKIEDICAIIVLDNPGDQEMIKRTYLAPMETGSTAGRIATDFFNFMGIPRNHLLILNKAPFHTTCTKNLKPLSRKIPDLFSRAQMFMADLTHRLHRALAAIRPDIKVWICGFAGCWSNGEWKTRNPDDTIPESVYLPNYFESLEKLYGNDKILMTHVNVVRHFSKHNIFWDLKGIKPRSLNGIITAKMKKNDVLNQLCSLPYAKKLFCSEKHR